MSGPIVRKYGFPNHEQIFGRRPLEHGDEPKKEDAKPDAGEPNAKVDDAAKSKTNQRGTD